MCGVSCSSYMHVWAPHPRHSCFDTMSADLELTSARPAHMKYDERIFACEGQATLWVAIILLAAANAEAAAGAAPVHSVRGGLQRCHHVVDDVRLQQRLIALNVDHYIVLLRKLRHRRLAPLRACTAQPPFCLLHKCTLPLLLWHSTAFHCHKLIETRAIAMQATMRSIVTASNQSM